MTLATIAGLDVARPFVHYTPHRNWMNDPNGLVYHRGRWHLFYQYNPEGADWGNMSWGHASSTDLRQWTEHPVAIPYRDGEQIYSGSVVVSGHDADRLTAVYTSAYDTGRQAQSLATSDDDGRSWQPDAGNPVLDRGTDSFRDPKVVRFTDAQGRRRWIMVAVEAEERQVLFFASDDLRSWTFLSAYGPFGDDGVVWECPDLFPLPLDGDTDAVRWVLTLSTNPVGADADPAGSSMGYVVGHFDGSTFTAEQDRLVPLDHGRDYYAGVTFDSAPGGDVVMLGWMSNWRYAHAFPSTPWRGAMSLPRRLALRSIAGTPTLVQEPPRFVTEPLAATHPEPLDTTAPHRFALGGHALVELRWDPSRTGALHLHLQGEDDSLVEIQHDPEASVLRVTRSGSAAAAVHPDFPATSRLPLRRTGPTSLLISLDGPLLEVFVDGGEATASNLVTVGTSGLTATLRTDRADTVSTAVVELTNDARDDAGADPFERTSR